jgi:high-affinity Fe2+/Pb2+ permease
VAGGVGRGGVALGIGAGAGVLVGGLAGAVLDVAGGVLPQAASNAESSSAAIISGAGASRLPGRHNRAMDLLVLEALLALAVLLFIVWWTMFAGRSQGEPALPMTEREAEAGPNPPPESVTSSPPSPQPSEATRRPQE